MGEYWLELQAWQGSLRPKRIVDNLVRNVKGSKRLLCLDETYRMTFLRQVFFRGHHNVLFWKRGSALETGRLLLKPMTLPFGIQPKVAFPKNWAAVDPPAGKTVLILMELLFVIPGLTSPRFFSKINKWIRLSINDVFPWGEFGIWANSVVLQGYI